MEHRVDLAILASLISAFVILILIILLVVVVG